MGTYTTKTDTVHVFTITDDEMQMMSHGHTCKIRLESGQGFVEINRT